MFRILLLIVVLSVAVFGQARSQRISTTCPGSTERAEIKILNGDIVLKPCPNKSVITSGATGFAEIDGQNLTTEAAFNSTTSLTTNTLTQTSGNFEKFRLGNNYQFFETSSRLSAPLNDIRLRTNETAPPAGGFAQLWLMSDAGHSYAYLYAQRLTTFYTDGINAQNFFGNGKWRMFLEMPNVADVGETLGRWRVGNFADQTNFIDLQNAPGSMKLTFGALDGVFVRNKFHIPTQTLAGSTEPCSAGQINWDSDYIYVCITDNVWKRALLGNF